MKFKHKCEYSGCMKSANRRLKNNHWVCDEHFKRLKRRKRNLGYNIFFKEIYCGQWESLKIYKDVPIKF